MITFILLVFLMCFILSFIILFNLFKYYISRILGIIFGLPPVQGFFTSFSKFAILIFFLFCGMSFVAHLVSHN
jgi:hypothetical protein